MKRKVIQIAESTQLISLPRKWAQMFGVKKGEELELQEKGNKLIISTEKAIDIKKINADISLLDRTSIIFYIRSLYRKGYDEIELHFSNPLVPHFRVGNDVSVISIIHEEVRRLLGFEIILQKENMCVIKDISSVSFKEFETVMRRILRLFVDAMSDFVKGCKEGNTILLDTIEEKHDSITRFTSYALRILNKSGLSDEYHNSIVYTIIVFIDKMTDVIKYSAREMLKENIKLSKTSCTVLDLLLESCQLYDEIFYKFNNKKVFELYNKRNDALEMLKKTLTSLGKREIWFITEVRNLFEYIVAITEARLSLLQHLPEE
ncbi:AbrB/MazE/SpoVT family DNA-binding domain-containing protein [Candidatus Woesearchaeota archaeon]|nr:AbrB/MazE/SpoVT family DNA-binding domain-containing protein [Candidatus Woesearchaeota archaeon]